MPSSYSLKNDSITASITINGGVLAIPHDRGKSVYMINLMNGNHRKFKLCAAYKTHSPDLTIYAELVDQYNRRVITYGLPPHSPSIPLPSSVKPSEPLPSLLQRCLSIFVLG